MKSAIFLSVREKATRLPKKVLLDLQGKTVTERLIERLKLAREPDLVVMATSVHPGDTVLVDLARKEGIEVFRGSEEDKLDRYLGAAREFGVDFMVVVDGDDLYADPGYIDRAVECFRRTGADYITQDGLPLGCASFGVKTEALEKLMAVKEESDTEVWGAYFAETGLFQCEFLPADEEDRCDDLRLTLDYPEDFELIRTIFERLYPEDPAFPLCRIVDLIRAEPELNRINDAVKKRYAVDLRRSAGVKIREDAKEILAGWPAGERKTK